LRSARELFSSFVVFVVNPFFSFLSAPLREIFGFVFFRG